jgi:hypothetical protein
MALLPKIQNKNVYSFNDAQALINPSNVFSDMGKAISTDLYNRVYQAEKQSNEELINQLKDMFVIRDMIDKLPNNNEREELFSQYSALQRALEENSSSLNSFSKTIIHSFMKKGIGKNGQFTSAQDILMSVGGGIKGELFPVFQGIIDQTSTFLKNRSDRKERVEEDIMKNIGSKPSSNNNTTEEQFSSERKNFSDVTNGENNTSVLEHIDMNVDELLSKFKTEDGRIDAFKVESFLSELSEKFGEPLEAEAFGEAMRDILSIELSKLSSEQIKEFKDSMNSEKGNLLLEKSVSFDGYNENEKPVIIDTLKEMMASQADLLMSPKREMKDFTSLEAQEEYQRDSIKEERRTADGIEKLCGILTGEKRKSSADGNSGGGGVISNVIDSGKDLLLAKMGLDKFFGKDKASKGGVIKKTLGGLSSKAGGIFKKAGGWLTSLGGGALLSGGGTSDIGDVATEVLTDTATDKVVDKGTDALKTAGKETVKDSAVKKSGKGIFGSAGKKIAKSLGGAGAKSFLKKIPGISILAGAGFGLSRLLEGDFTGALGELASGVAGTVPGMGTAVSTAIDAGLAARDISKETEEVVPPAQKVEANPFEESILPDVDTITDIDYDYSQSSFEDVSIPKESNVSVNSTKENVTPKKYVTSRDQRKQLAWEKYGRFSNPIIWGDGVEEQEKRRLVTREAWNREGLGKSFSTLIWTGEKSRDVKRNEAELDIISHGANVLNDAGLFYGDADRVKQMEERGESSRVYQTKYGDNITYTIKQLEDGQKVLEKYKSSRIGGIGGMLEQRGFKTADDLTDTFTPQSTALTDTSIYKNKDGTWKSDEQILNEGTFTSSQDPLFELELYKRNEAFRKESGNSWTSLTKDELTQLNEGTAKTSELIQHPSNATKNDAYTSQPTRTSVPEKKDTSTQKQETKQQPTVINNFNTTNNNVTQSAPQRSPQLLINPSGSYMGERQPTSR